MIYSIMIYIGDTRERSMLMPKVNKTRYAILGVLTLMPCSGYDIKKFCDRGISFFWHENFGHLYPVLKQMEKDGLITKKAERNEGRPPRNVYFITPKGRDTLTDWLLRPTEHSPPRLELLLKLSFAKNIPAEKMIEELARIKDKHNRFLEEYLQIERALSADDQASRDAGYPYWLATLRYGIGDARFRIEWCEETIRSIKDYQRGR